jgi:uncharacterized protein with NRDE domain
MCLLAILYRVVEDAAVVVGANREEYFARGGDPPRRLDDPAGAVAGVDPLAGGTWLGVNRHGVLIAVTNRRKSKIPATPRSRGLLARALLGCTRAEEAGHRAARELAQERYAGCNLLCADAQYAVVIHSGDWLRIRPLPPGIHVLSNRDVNDPTDWRVQYAVAWLGQGIYRSSGDCVKALRELCVSHDPPGAPICFTTAEGGCVSSSIVALRSPLGESIYLHAQGPPDVTAYEDCSGLLGEW